MSPIKVKIFATPTERKNLKSLREEVESYREKKIKGKNHWRSNSDIDKDREKIYSEIEKRMPFILLGIIGIIVAAVAILVS